MRSLIILLLLPVGGYLLLCLLLFAGQRSHIYYPVRESEPPGAQSMRIRNGDVDLKIWVVSRPGPKAILYFGGNAEDVGVNRAAFSSAFPGHSLYLVNYRGYGGSSGRPSETGLHSDALAIHDALAPRHAQMIVVGRSLGSGVAVQLASERPVERLVLVTPFDSLVAVATDHFRYLPVTWLMRDRFESAGRAASIGCPVLVVIAGGDEIISRARSDALVAAFRTGQAAVKVLAGAGHNDLDGDQQYLESIAEFIGRGPGV